MFCRGFMKSVTVISFATCVGNGDIETESGTFSNEILSFAYKKACKTKGIS